VVVVLAQHLMELELMAVQAVAPLVQDQAFFKLADRLQAAKVQQAEDHFTLHTRQAAVVQLSRVQIQQQARQATVVMVRVLTHLGDLQPQRVKTFQEHIGMQAVVVADVKV
jgi:hypothetical protein